MDYVIVTAHVLGSIVILVVMGIGFLEVDSWLEAKELKAATEDAALSLGITLKELDEVKHTDDIVAYYQHKYTSERFNNRVADFIGVVLTIWNWLGVIANLCFLGFIAWVVIDQSLDDAIYAWINLAIALVFYLSSFTVGLVAKVVLGRYPSEPKRARALLADYIERQKELVRREKIVEEFNSMLVK